MKICYFVGVDRHHDEVLVFRQAKVLKDKGNDVSFVVSDDEPDEIYDDILVKGIGYKAKGYLNRLLGVPFRLYRKLKEIDADIYQTCSIDQLITCLLLMRKKKKIVFHLREGHPYTYYSKSKNPLLVKKVIVWMLSSYMKFAFKKFNAIITVTEDIARYLKSWGIDKVYIHGNYPSVNNNHNLTLEEYKKRENRILYFGSIYSISRQEIFFDAVSNIGKVKYCIAGKFWGNVTYENKLKEHSFWKNVEFINGFKKEELSELLQKATISNVLRDFSETQSPNGSLGVIKIFESMEAGLPIICSDVPVYREIMNKYKCGILVNPNNVKEIENAIEYLIDNKEEAYKMGQEGRRAIIEKYSWDALSKEYIIIMETL